MVSEDHSPSDTNSTSNILHHFIISNSIDNNQNQFPNFDPYSNNNNQTNNPYALMDLLGTSNEPTRHTQRLSLSLGSVPSRQTSLNSNFIDPSYLIQRQTSCDYVPFVGSGFFPPCSTSYENEPFSLGNSKYLKPAQLLLEEMVNVAGKEIDRSNEKYVRKLSRGSKKGAFALISEMKAEFFNSQVMSDKQETYVNLVKLLALLEEVERRYEDYYHHLDELVSSFEVISGLGSGKSYTALALHAMSKHFCSLRNAILSQILAAKQKIEKDMPKISSRLSQLSLFDQEGRSNRVSLQQLGVMQNCRQVWRPIRGLPENSVTILRAWLFEHFLNPYPNDTEKVMLASQTGLSKNQVSNWFINARVRLWKPMIEEMYKEEFAESSIESDPLLTREGVGDSADELN